MYLFEDILQEKKLPKGWKRNPETGFIDVRGDVYFSGKNLKHLPYQFGVVTGDFDCDNNQLTSLEGAPKEVQGYFDCANNQLTSLEGAPKEVQGYFDCDNNKLRSYKFLPQCPNYEEAKREIKKQMKEYLISLGYKLGTAVFRAMMKELENS